MIFVFLLKINYISYYYQLLTSQLANILKVQPLYNMT